MSKIWNKDTILDQRDLKIAQLSSEIRKLKKMIESFKEYDTKRTAEIKDALIRLGELESQQDERDYEKGVSELRKKYKVLKKQVAALSAKLHIQKVIEMGDGEALIIVNNIFRNQELNKLRNFSEKAHSFKCGMNPLLFSFLFFNIFSYCVF